MGEGLSGDFVLSIAEKTQQGELLHSWGREEV